MRNDGKQVAAKSVCTDASLLAKLDGSVSSFDIVKDSSAQLFQSLCTRHFREVSVCHAFKVNTTITQGFADTAQAPVIKHNLIVLKSFY